MHAEHCQLDRRLGWAIGLNGVIVIVEIFGGFFSGSLALLSDALHNLSDVAALGLALVARRLSRRAHTVAHTYGLGRTEVLAALANSAALLVSSTLICREAIARLVHPQIPQSGMMLAVALIGLAANLIAVLLLRQHAHDDLNLRSAFLHLAQDTASSVAVVIAALLVKTRFGLYFDPLASLLIVALILRSGWRLLRHAVHILLQGAPPDVDLNALQRDIQTSFPVRGLHHVHLWEIKPGRRVLSAHILLADMPLCETEMLLKQIRAHLMQKWAIAYATLEPETRGCGSEALIADSAETRQHTRSGR